METPPSILLNETEQFGISSPYVPQYTRCLLKGNPERLYSGVYIKNLSSEYIMESINDYIGCYKGRWQ